jgi:predicted MPP superfamily phosphohydrolase
MLLGARFLFDTLIALLAMALLPGLFDRLFSPATRNLGVTRVLLLSLYLVLAGGAVLALRLAVVGPLYEPLPEWRAVGLGLSFTVLGCGLLSNFIPPERPVDTGRRDFLRNTARLLAASPAAVAGYGTFIERHNFRLTEVDLPVTGLPRDLEGLRIVQLSDIHLGPFMSARELVRLVDMANGTRPHLAVVTGDLISDLGDPLDDALAALKNLKADAGILGCHGNHEIHARAEDYATREGARLGLRFLRQQSQMLQFGQAWLNVAGVDHQSERTGYLRGTEKLVKPGAINLLLSHNPDVFPIAAQKGFGVTLAGHTHGGQVNLEILRANLNIATLYTPYTLGLYREGPASIYVTSGIGTIGVPVRFGAPPEVALLRLRAT